MFEDCTGKGQPFFTPGVAKYAMKAVTKAVTMVSIKLLTNLWLQSLGSQIDCIDQVLDVHDADCSKGADLESAGNCGR